MQNILHAAKLITAIRWHHSKMRRIIKISILHIGNDLIASSRSGNRNGLIFFIRTSKVNAFSLMLHRQRKGLAKRKPDENGVLLNKSYQKPTHITQNFLRR
jgi:hypothetical protein